jgi:hypothetical protein
VDVTDDRKKAFAKLFPNWRTHPDMHAAQSPHPVLESERKMQTMSRLGSKVGAVEEWAVQSLKPMANQDITGTMLFSHYVAWCGDANAVPLRSAEFHAVFEQLADKIGMVRMQRGANISFADVGFLSQEA